MAPRLIAGIFLAALALSGCKQGLGELCQVNDDCETGLCNPVTGRCQEEVVTTADAAPTPTPDAAPPADAPATDAGVDAQPASLTE